MSSATSERMNELVRAGAGAGKTTALCEKVLEVARSTYLTEGRLPRMVITTFTRKATEELRERITLAVLGTQDENLRDLVTSRQYLQISTIHGVLLLFLRSYGHLVQMPLEIQLVDEEVSRLMAKKCLRQIVAETGSESDILSKFSFEDLVDSCLSFRRIHMIAPRARAVSKGDMQNSVDDFYNKFAIDLSQQVEEILSEVENEKWRAYLLSLQSCLKDPRNLGQKILDLGKRPQFRGEPFDPSLYERFSKTLKKLSELEKHPGMNTQLWDQFIQGQDQFRSLAEKFVINLNEQKIQSSQFDSEDLELFSLDVLRKEPSLGRSFAKEWDHWLVDEYQDTSPTQVELLSYLIGETPAFFVGDPQQSIYLFRGARKEVFAQREKWVQNSGGQLRQLSTNYRSAPELLMAINHRIRDLGADFTEMEPRSKQFDPNHVALHFFEVESSEEQAYSSMAKFIQDQLVAGGRADDFCVLARTNQVLLDVAVYFESLGLPCCVHAASGFFSRREVVDLMSLFRFLWNPFDRKNLIRLLRSPWYFMSDRDLVIASGIRANSLWHALLEMKSDEPVVQKLQSLLDKSRRVGVVEAFMEGLLECRIVDLSHWHDPTGRRESNIWKLVNWIRSEERSPGFTPARLHRFFDRALQGFDEESDAAASKEPNRINLMTVHKSKGLSFKHVLLPNMEKVPRYSGARAHESKVIFDEENQTWGLATTHESVTVHSPSSLFCVKKMEDREQEENRRLLYVAMTRAETSIGFHAVKGKGDYSEGSWASCFNFGELGTGGARHYSVTTHTEGAMAQARTQSELPGALIPPALDFSARASTQRLSVTRLLEAAVEPSESVSNLQSIERSVRAPSLGTVLHEAFERLKYLPSDQVIHGIRKYVGSDFKKFESAVHYVLNLHEPPMLDLIKAGEVEWGFQLQTKKGVLEGQIDLWGVVKGQAWVVDYKSGLGRDFQKAFEQLQMYAAALHRIYGINDFKLAIVYPLGAQVEVQHLKRPSDVLQKYEL